MDSIWLQISGVPAQTVQVTTGNNQRTSTDATQTNSTSTVQSPESKTASPSRRRQQMSPRRAAARSRARQQNLMAVAQNNQNQVCAHVQRSQNFMHNGKVLFRSFCVYLRR